MPRVLTSAQKAGVYSRVKRIATFVDVQIPGNRLLVWDGVGYVTVAGLAYAGVGQYGMIENIKNELSVVASGINMTIFVAPGMDAPPDFVTKTRGLNYQGAKTDISFALVDIDTDLPTLGIFGIWSGNADVMSFSLGRQISSSLSAENFSSHLRRMNTYRCTSQSHNDRIGNPAIRDTFFDYNTRLNARAMIVTP